MSKKPVPPSMGKIEDELAANLKALGLAGEVVGESIEDRAVAALERMIRKEGRLVSGREVAAEIGVCPNTALAALDRAVRNGRVIRTKNSATSRPCFVPRVT